MWKPPAQAALSNTLRSSHLRILTDPPPIIAVGELAESSVNFVVQPWVKNTDYLPVKLAFTELVKVEFDAHGITIPYPQMDVHVQKAAELLSPDRVE